MKLLVLSDSHGAIRYMERAVVQYTPDRIIHLGDLQEDAEELSRRNPSIPMLSVCGNCDMRLHGQDTVTTVIEGIPLLLTHGHRYSVKRDCTRLEYAAMEQQVKVALFGHTHVPTCRLHEGIWFLNPGSCGGGTTPTCGMVETYRGNLFCHILPISMEEETKI